MDKSVVKAKETMPRWLSKKLQEIKKEVVRQAQECFMLTLSIHWQMVWFFKLIFLSSVNNKNR